MKPFYFPPLVPLFAALLINSAHGVTVPVLRDALVAQVAPTWNYGGRVDFIVTGSTTVACYAFLKFDPLAALPSFVVPADVEKATLYIFVDSITTAGTFTVDAVPAPTTASPAWLEGNKPGAAAVAGTLTWGTRPADQAPPADVAKLVLAASAITKEYVAVDVTKMVRDWIVTPSANNGMILRAAGVSPTANATFQSREGAHPPFLSIALATKRVVPQAGDLSMGAFGANP